MNITAEQRTLLEMLVLMHQMNDGAQFILVRSFTDAALCYPRGISLACAHQDADFHQLQRENLIILSRNSGGQLCGKPSEFGITTILSDDPWRKNPFPVGTREHEIVNDTMLSLKEHLALFSAEMLGTIPPEHASAQEFLEHRLKALAGTFDVWAGVFFKSAVLTDDAASSFERLLNEIEKAVLAQAIKFRATFVPAQIFSSEAKTRLNSRKQYWIGQMLRRVREHKEASRAKAAANEGDGSEPRATTYDEPRAHAERDGDPTPKPQETAPGVETNLSWNERLRAARKTAKLSRPGAAKSLKNKGVQITADAIKKHEEGAAMPRPEVRQAYAAIYKTTEDALFR